VDPTEATQFRRMRLHGERDRATDMIIKYREGIDFYRRKTDYYNEVLGHIAASLGEPEPSPPKEPQ
jgi:hypothetical protein